MASGYARLVEAMKGRAAGLGSKLAAHGVVHLAGAVLMALIPLQDQE